jgi:glycosyltransferase involved in cell wall biosynthesis
VVGEILNGGLRLRGVLKECGEGRPLVSIVTVALNAGHNLKSTIESVLNQTYDCIEYIVIDGGSSDGTVGLLLNFDKVIDYWISEADDGIYDAMNKGISLCRGDLIGIIGAGDLYLRTAVESAVNARVKTNADIIYGNVELIDAATGLCRPRFSNVGDLRKTMSAISHPSTFTHRALYKTFRFDTRFNIAADYDLFLGFHENGRRFEHCGAFMTRILSGGLSSSSATIFEVFDVHKKYYGVIYAIRRLIPAVAANGFYIARKWLLLKCLSPQNFQTLRKWYLSRKM